MASSDPLLSRLTGLELTRLGPSRPAGLWLTSLPLPRGATTDLSLADRPAFCDGLGQWPDVADVSPRRLLMVADADGQSPDQLTVTAAAAPGRDLPPTAAMQLIRRSPERFFVWEQHALRLVWHSQDIELALGLRCNGATYWWQACRLVELSADAHCRVVEMGGVIPLASFGEDDWYGKANVANPALHRHAWLNGHIRARLHANGVCEISARHVNSKFFDDGLPLEGATPVLGIRCNGVTSYADMCGVWDGTRSEFTVGKVRFDVSDAAHLATPAQPGAVDSDDGFLVWQPYQGVELFGGQYSILKGGDGWFFHPEDQVIPRGMSRTLRFSLSLSDQSPAVVRYLPPAWWYAVCEEFSPAPLLPIENVHDAELQRSRDWISDHMLRGGFEDGALPRGTSGTTNGRYEPGWEGEIQHGQFLSAWQTGEASAYDDALRAAYYFHDVVVDHAVKAARMPGYPPNAFALPHARVQGMIAAYLETGDTFLLNTSRAVIETAHWTHKNSWPRLAVGRDAAYLRGAIMLYRYFAVEQFREMAADGLQDVLAAQRPDGSFGDQGGGTHMHQYGSYISKPWMGLIAVAPLMDYLELFPESDDLAAGVKLFADWLMAERFEHNGGMGWTYQHYYDGVAEMKDYVTGEIKPTKTPDSGIWHVEYLARTLMFCALRYDEPAYFAAWSDSYDAMHAQGDHRCWDHSCAQSLQYLPWLQARLWRLQLTADGLVSQPCWLGPATPTTGKALTPVGKVTLSWSGDHTCHADGAPVRFLAQAAETPSIR